MSGGKKVMSGSGKRISVFDRLGPGADESGTHHRAYSSDKHSGGGSYGNTSSGPEKGGRSHGYSSSGSSQHKDDGARERKPRHRSSGEASVEVDTGEEKRTSSMKVSRDTSEVKPGGGGGGAAGSGSKCNRGSQPSGDDDYDDVLDETKRKKAHRGGIMDDRSKHVPLDEEGHGIGRRTGRERKDKVGVVSGSRLDRMGSSSMDTAANKSPDKIHSRREMGGATSQADHKRRKEEEYKIELVAGAGQKRRRDVHDDLSYSMMDANKKSRRRDHSRDSDPHHYSSGGPADGGRYHYGGLATGKDGDYYHGNSSGRSRRAESGSGGGGDTARRRTRLSQTPEPPESGGSGKQGRSHHRMDREDGRRSGVEGAGERKTEGEHRTEEAPPPPKARSLDWTAVQAFSTKANSKLPRAFSSVLDKFKPGVVLADLKVSASLAGSRHSKLVQEAIIRNGGGAVGSLGGGAGGGCGDVTDGSPGRWQDKTTERCGERVLQETVDSSEGEEKTTNEEKMDVDEMRSGLEVREKVGKEETMEVEDSRGRRLTWESLAGECLLSCRRALTAADDYAIRRRLRKDHRGYLATARATPDRWTTDQYANSVQLYNFVPTKPSGKPATKLLSSRVGSVVISR